MTIRQGFRAPDPARGGQFKHHNYYLSKPPKPVVNRSMEIIGKSLGGAMRDLGVNIRSDRIRDEQQARQDARNKILDARADARLKMAQDEHSYRQDRREDDDAWKDAQRRRQYTEWSQKDADRAGTLDQRKMQLNDLRDQRRSKVLTALHNAGRNAKNPNEWNNIIKRYDELGYGDVVRPYADYENGRRLLSGEIGGSGTTEALKRRKLELDIQKKENELKKKGEQADTSAAQNIANGLSNLARIPKEAGDWSFESSVGPLQGDPDALLGPLARAGGSLANVLGGQNTTEIRARIAGDVEALAAAIKPLIRKPGEGPWTDSDQRRLVAVVGNLSEARSVEEYNRGLENVRQRIISNFGIQVPPIPDISAESAEAPAGPSGVSSPVPSSVKITVREN